MLEVVRDMNDEIVSPVGDDGRTWDGAIEGQRLALVSIGGKSGILN